MQTTVIGVDPHKRSHTAVVLDEDEQVAAEVRVAVQRRQAQQLLAWAEVWPQRYWAVENAGGLGRWLAQQLVAAGETVVDVPASLSARARKLSGDSARKSDQADARSVVIAARHHRRLHQVEGEDLTVAIRAAVERRAQLVDRRQSLMCQLHELLAELSPGGVAGRVSIDKASRLLRRVRTYGLVDDERRVIARELLEEWRWLNTRINRIERRLRDLLAVHGTTLTELHGLGDINAAKIIGVVGDPGRFPTEGHFAAYNATAPLEASSGEVRRHRLNRGGNRQLNSVLHTVAKTQIRDHTPGRDYYRRKLAEGKTEGEALRALKRQLSDAVYRRLRRDTRR